ncbi:MAG: hypothetical protein LAN84_16395 [Acidobacteriia bacterium]|nr:hypothetical protein [Terriglobia bacterium]
MHPLAASAPQAPKPGAAQGSDLSLCTFVKKIVAAAPGEFAELKGQEDTIGGAIKDHTLFQGTLLPGPSAECTLFIRRKDGSQILPPLYFCALGSPRPLADAKPLYEKDVAELRACFPSWPFTEKREGNESDRKEVWTLSTQQPGIRLNLTLSDWGIGLDPNSPDFRKPGVVVSLEVTDTAPAAMTAPDASK